MKISIIPPDKCIVMDGVALHFDYTALKIEGIHAIHWDSERGYGGIEYLDGGRGKITDTSLVDPFIDAYNTEKGRRCQEEADKVVADEAQKSADAAAQEAFYSSPEQVAIREVEAAKKKLAAIDLASIRSMREKIAAMPDAPQYVKDYEAQAVAERGVLAAVLAEKESVSKS